MMSVPVWALSLAYWLHMLATVVWIGSLACLSLLILPAARRNLDILDYANLLDRLQKRLDPLGWFCLALLIGTGLIQMVANPNYGGFLTIENRWAIAILIKHIFFLGMILVSGYLTWFLLPQMRRLMLSIVKQDRSAQEETLANINRRERRLIVLNFILGVIILGLTAIARAS